MTRQGTAPGSLPPQSCCVDDEALARMAERGLEAAASPLQIEHLAECPECRSLLAALVLDRLPGEPPPLRATPRPRPGAWAWVARPALAAPALGLLLLGLSVLAAPWVSELLAPPPPVAPADVPQSAGSGRAERPARTPLPPTAETARPLAAPPSSAAALRPAPLSDPAADAAAAAAPPSPPAALAAPPDPIPPARRARRAPALAQPEAPTPPAPAAAAAAATERQERAERHFVDAMVDYQAHRYGSAVKGFEAALAAAPNDELRSVAERWLAKSRAEWRGRCQPGFERRTVLLPAAPQGGLGQPGPTSVEECVPSRD